MTIFGLLGLYLYGVPGQPKSEFASFRALTLQVLFKNIVKHYSLDTNIYRWESRMDVCDLTKHLFVEMGLQEGRTWI